jgi:hypothetical protein
MKVVIAGSRYLKNADIQAAVDASCFDVTEVIQGGEPNGVDWSAKQWAIENGIPHKDFEADWYDLSHPDARIKVGRDGREYDAEAGPRRNGWQADYAAEGPEPGGLIAIPCPKSKGTWDMVRKARERGLKIYIHKEYL